MDIRVLKIVFPATVFVFLYSFLPHKELRFIIYVFPMFNTAAAVACAKIWNSAMSKKRWRVTGALLALVVAGHVAGNAAFSAFMAHVSHYNYPGGDAISRLHEIVPQTESASVHLANLACQSGISRCVSQVDFNNLFPRPLLSFRFTQINDNWSYDKTERLQPSDKSAFDYLIVEADDSASQNEFKPTHEIMDSVDAYAGIDVDYRGKRMPPVGIRTKPSLIILKRLQ